MLIAESTRSTFHPPVPETIEALGIPSSVVFDLVLRRLYLKGMCNFQTLSEALKISPLIVEGVFRQLRHEQLIEVRGMQGNDYNFTLTQAGRQMAMERFQLSQYAGPAPVSLKDYHASTKTQAARVSVNRKILRDALSDLVLPDQVLDQLGPSVISHKSIFIYGSTGAGKSSIAERILRVYQDSILVPYTVEVDGQYVMLYDPVVHERVESESHDLDPRWVRCRRPCIIAGGELVYSMLELRLDEATGVYAAPLQMKANNGIFVIDDFGRQVISPRELLNRWMVPLDRRVDYLSLRYGVKFQVPFEVLVVFATNLDPHQLADEAFLRRIQNKIKIEAVDPESFDEILRRAAAGRAIPLEPDSGANLRALCLQYSRELRACFPADICHILASISEYEGRPPSASESELERATSLYFARSDAQASTSLE